MRQRVMRTVKMLAILNRFNTLNMLVILNKLNTLKMLMIETARASWHRRGEALSPATWRRWGRRLSPGSATPSAIPALDGLRGVAVLLVMVFHAYHPAAGPVQYRSLLDALSYGHTGVQLFFVLSGFLLFLPYARWLFGLQDAPSTLKFYQRRILRVGPAYWVNILLIMLFTTFSARRFASVLAHALFLQNFFFDSQAHLNGVLWTMAVEVQFYLLLPLLAWAIYQASRLLPRWFSVGIILAGCEAVSMLCDAFVRNHIGTSIPLLSTGLIDSHSSTYWLGVFALGMGCAVLYVYTMQIRWIGPLASRGVRSLASAAFIVGLGLAISGATAPQLDPLLPFKELAYGWMYGGILLGVLLGWTALRWPFERGFLRFLGHVSYSLYLWHLVVLMQIEPHLTLVTNPALHTLVGFLLDAAISIPLAYVSYLLTERPFFSLRRRTRDTGVAVETANVDRQAASVVESPVATSLRGHARTLIPAASRSVESDTTFQIGQVIGGYRLERQLDSSVHGMNFQARRVPAEPLTWKAAMTPERVVIMALDTPVGLVSARDAAAFHRRFEREAVAVQSVCGLLIQSAISAGVAQYIDIGWSADPRHPYVIRAYVDGESLGSILARHHRGMPPDAIARYLTQIAAGLDYVHVRGLRHGSLNLDNVIISEEDTLHVTDIGLQQLFRPITRFVPPLADPALARYTAPERYDDRRRITPASDIYSLGVVLYALVCGALPFSGSTVTDVRRAQQDTAPIPPRAYRSDLSDDIESVMLKAIAYSPKERFATAGELASAFSAAIEGATAETSVLAISSLSARLHD